MLARSLVEAFLTNLYPSRSPPKYGTGKDLRTCKRGARPADMHWGSRAAILENGIRRWCLEVCVFVLIQSVEVGGSLGQWNR